MERHQVSDIVFVSSVGMFVYVVVDVFNIVVVGVFVLLVVHYVLVGGGGDGGVVGVVLSSSSCFHVYVIHNSN